MLSRLSCITSCVIALLLDHTHNHIVNPQKRKTRPKKWASKTLPYGIASTHPEVISADTVPTVRSRHQPRKQMQKQHHWDHHLTGGSSNVSDDVEDQSESSSNR